MDKSGKNKKSKLSNGFHPHSVNGHSDNIPNGDTKHYDDDSKDTPPRNRTKGNESDSRLSPKQMMNGQHTKSDVERARDSIEMMQRRRCDVYISESLVSRFEISVNFGQTASGLSRRRVYGETQLRNGPTVL